MLREYRFPTITSIRVIDGPLKEVPCSFSIRESKEKNKLEFCYYNDRGVLITTYHIDRDLWNILKDVTDYEPFSWEGQND